MLCPVHRVRITSIGLLEHLEADVAGGQWLTEHVLVEVLAGSDAEVEAPVEHGGRRGRSLGDDSGMNAKGRAGDSGRDPKPCRGRDAADGAPHEWALALRVSATDGSGPRSRRSPSPPARPSAPAGRAHWLRAPRRKGSNRRSPCELLYPSIRRSNSVFTAAQPRPGGQPRMRPWPPFGSRARPAGWTRGAPSPRRAAQGSTRGAGRAPRSP